MNTPRLRSLALVAVAAATLTACESILDVEPRQSISSELALTTKTGFEGLLNSVYDNLQGVSYYGQTYILAPGILADNIDQTAANSNRYTATRVNNPGAHITTWSTHYVGINEANNIITQIDDLDDPRATDEDKARIKGEALFLRALNYFDLARTKGYEPGMEVDGFDLSVPLRTEPTLDIDQAVFVERQTNEAVYRQIESDLLAAIDLLEPPSADVAKYRANRSAAQALLSRVYLYWQRWDEAARLASDALASTNAVLLPDSAAYVSAFRSQTNPESLFEINYVAGIEDLGSDESLVSLTTDFGWGDFIPTTDLLNTYEAGDARLGLYKPGNKQGQDVLYIQKYPGARGAWTDNIPVIRYSEVLLNRAEAYAELGRDQDARDDLNALRSRLGLDDVTASGEALLEAILQERRLELAFEGHRYFDLKRRGLDIPKPQVPGILEIPYEDYRILAPLPSNEVELSDGLLKQNPGYAGGS